MPRRTRSGRGGSRTPATPAQHSGPGSSSARTDGQPSTGSDAPQPPPFPASEHGGRQETQAMQQAGQVPGGGPAGGPTGTAPSGAPVDPSSLRDPFSQPTQRPSESGFEGLPRPAASQGPSPGQVMQQIDMATVAPALPVLEALSQRPGSSVTLRNTVRRLRSMVPSDFNIGDVFTNIQDVLAADEDAAGVATPAGEEAPE